MERDPRALKEELESPVLERIQLALVTCTALDPRVAQMSRVLGQPLLRQHREGYSEHLEQGGRVEVYNESFDLGFQDRDGRKDCTG